jgi:hypothetical protein
VKENKIKRAAIVGRSSRKFYQKSIRLLFSVLDRLGISPGGTATANVECSFMARFRAATVRLATLNVRVAAYNLSHEISVSGIIARPN